MGSILGSQEGASSPSQIKTKGPTHVAREKAVACVNEYG